MTGPGRRMCILTDGFLDVFTAKTAMGLLRYCPDEVVAVLDRRHVGLDLESLVGVGRGIPIVESIEDARHLGADELVLGVALPGGALPPDWRRFLREALSGGMDVVNGLHTRLNEDPELAELAAKTGRTLWDVRVPPKGLRVGAARARTTRGRRLLTIGTDCNLGKRVTALEIVKELKRRGVAVEFVPTGQTGVMTCGWGIAVDGVVSDFVSGAVESMILEKAETDFIVVEGQGALAHPSYSAVTLGLMHGAVPDYMILCHAPSRTAMRNSDVPVMSLPEMIALSEAAMRPIHPSRVIGVSLNCHGMSDDAASEAIRDAAARTGLPVVDSLRTGVRELVDAMLPPEA